jgi:hypothetical protein
MKTIEDLKVISARRKESMRISYIKNFAKGRHLTTKEEYDVMLKNQNSRCKICGISEDELNRVLYIDHDHKTNKVRGLLCTSCNNGIGQFKDSIELLKNAVNYLESV